MTQRMRFGISMAPSHPAGGTPTLLIDNEGEQIERLVKQSNGEFGAHLQLAHDWADPDAKFRSHELFARPVMAQSEGHHNSTVEAKNRARVARPGLAESNLAVETSTAKYQQELADKAASATS